MAGLSQAALAEKVGLSRQSIIALEQGKDTFELAAAFRCLRALDTDLLVPAPLATTPTPQGRSIGTKPMRQAATRQPEKRATPAQQKRAKVPRQTVALKHKEAKAPDKPKRSLAAHLARFGKATR